MLPALSVADCPAALLARGRPARAVRVYRRLRPAATPRTPRLQAALADRRPPTSASFLSAGTAQLQDAVAHGRLTFRRTGGTERQHHAR